MCNRLKKYSKISAVALLAFLLAFSASPVHAQSAPKITSCEDVLTAVTNNGSVDHLAISLVTSPPAASCKVVDDVNSSGQTGKWVQAVIRATTERAAFGSGWGSPTYGQLAYDINGKKLRNWFTDFIDNSIIDNKIYGSVLPSINRWGVPDLGSIVSYAKSIPLTTTVEIISQNGSGKSYRVSFDTLVLFRIDRCRSEADLIESQKRDAEKILNEKKCPEGNDPIAESVETKQIRAELCKPQDPSVEKGILLLKELALSGKIAKKVGVKSCSHTLPVILRLGGYNFVGRSQANDFHKHLASQGWVCNSAARPEKGIGLCDIGDKNKNVAAVRPSSGDHGHVFAFRAEQSQNNKICQRIKTRASKIDSKQSSVLTRRSKTRVSDNLKFRVAEGVMSTKNPAKSRYLNFRPKELPSDLYGKSFYKLGDRMHYLCIPK